MGTIIVFLIIGLALYLIFKGKTASSPAQKPPEHYSDTSSRPAKSAPGDGRNTTRLLSSSSPATSPSSISGGDAWVPPGGDISFKGYTIPGGMIYFDEYLSTVNGWGPDPALINPKLDVNRESPDREGRFMSYWPSYTDINPSSRAAYLEWLSTGKNDPNANIGYVFLYFYGLERRILCDSKESTKAASEIPALLDEIRRLLSIYGHNNSFNNYANNLISTAQVLYQGNKMCGESVPSFNRGYEYPLALKVALGQLAVAGIPLSAEWAMGWVNCDPSYYHRTPAQRCPEEFAKLFRHKYHERFGNGFVFKPNKTTIKGTYTPASRTFNGTLELRYDDLPDVTAVKRPIEQLKEIAELCIDELDAYSRYLGRNPGDKNSPAALALLPDICLDGHKDESVQGISRWLERSLSADYNLIDVSALTKFFPSLNLEPMAKKDSLAIAQLLSKLGVGIEPDVRFGGNPYKQGPVILFKVPSASFNTPTPAYSIATTILHLAAMVANANGSISPEEERHLEENLELWLHLNEDEKMRLRAHAKWLFVSQPGFSGVKKRIEQMSTPNRISIGKFLVSLAQSDGFIDADEMKLLSKIYNLLGLDPQELYSHAHNIAAKPVTVKLEDKIKTYSIPSASEKSEQFDLDMASIKAKIAETVEVTAILKGIFAEDDLLAPGAEPTAEPRTAIQLIPGLDTEYEEFASRLTKKTSWSRNELEQLASEMNILLDGTLEAINDASFEAFGESFFEGEDPIDLNTHILEEIIE